MDDGASRRSTPPSALHRLRWLLWVAALVAGIGGGLLIAVLRTSHGTPTATFGAAQAGPDETWAAGTRRAPDFRLADQAGRPVSLAAFRGRPVIVTFMDPLCHTLCPLEARVLSSVESRFPASQRPPIVSVSVNLWGDAPHRLLAAMREWKVRGGYWHWAVGGAPALRRVWHAYEIAVRATSSHDVEHTEAAYVVDARGYERALYLYPFTAADLARTVRQLAGR